MNGARILMVDDEAAIRLTLSVLLTRAGYDVTTAESGVEAIALLERQAFDLLLADLKMPGMNGMQLVAAARQRQEDLSIIVLTGHGSLESAVEGLHQGIFDYLLKTTAPPQVLERVQAALAARARTLRERSLLEVVGAAVQELRGRSPSLEEEHDAMSGERVLSVGALRLDAWRQEASLHGRTLSLTPTEFRVLLCLAERAGTMLSYASIVRSAQGYDTSELEAGELVKPHIHHLRQKLEPDPTAPRYLLNVRGKGYLLSPIGE
jgi:DNA-binding response OmpR family regulator